MTDRLLRLPLAGVALLLAVAVAAAQPPDPANDPLPKGAKVRFGITRPILRTSPAVALVPPKYTNFLAPTMTGGIRRYDLGTGRPLDKAGIVGPGQVVVSLDGRRAAVARPGSLTVVEVATGKELLAVEPPEGVLIVGTPGVSLSSDGKVLAYGGRGKDSKGAVVVWDVDKNAALAQLETAPSAPVYPTLSPDGKTLITHGPPAPAPTLNTADKPKPKAEENGDVARTAQVWEVASGKELFKAPVTGMGGMVVAAAFAPDGDLLAVSAADGPIDLWEVKTGKRVQTLLGRKGQGVRVAFAPDGKTVASIGPDYRIQQWTVEGKPLSVSEPPRGVLVAPITGLTFTDNERVIAWVTAAQFAVAWEALTGKLLSLTSDHLATIRTIALPEGAKHLFTSGQDGHVFRWDLATGILGEEIALRPAQLPGQPMIRPQVNLSANGLRAAWFRNPAEIFDLPSGDHLFCVPPPSSPPVPVNFSLSPDGLKLITTSRQALGKATGSCVIWDLETQQRVAEFESPACSNAKAPGAVLSQDGTRLVFATTNPPQFGKQPLLIVGYDLKTGKKLAEVEVPAGTGNVTVTYAVANETSVVITSNLGKVWSVDYANGKIEQTIDQLAVRGEPPIAGPVVFSPDGKRFAIGVVGEPFTTYGVRVYDWETKKALHTFLGHAGPVTALRFSADGSSLASGAQDTSVLLWDLTKLPGKK